MTVESSRFWVRAWQIVFVARWFSGLFFVQAHRSFRVFNEVTVGLFAAIVGLAVVRPF